LYRIAIWGGLTPPGYPLALLDDDDESLLVFDDDVLSVDVVREDDVVRHAPAEGQLF
jgi:hypothetical protein